MTEAWLLADESAIRCAAGNPNGRVNLNLPDLQAIEDLPTPRRFFTTPSLLQVDLTPGVVLAWTCLNVFTGSRNTLMTIAASISFLLFGGYRGTFRFS
jgi:hypothetical protein